MNRMVLPLSALLLALSGQAAKAQVGFRPVQPLAGPPVSPLLNLTRSGVNPAIAYYGLVRPQQQQQAELQQLQQQQVATQSYLDNTNLLNQPLLNTGTGAGFMTSSKYFQTNGRAGSSGAGAGYTQPQLLTNNFGAVRPH